MAKLIVIDIGNSVYKVSCVEGDVDVEFNFPSRVKSFDIANLDLSEAIVHNDVCLAIGQGDYIHDNIKYRKDNLEHLILYAISRAVDSNNEEVNLMLNLPITQLANKDELKLRLEGKTFQYTYNSPSTNVRERNMSIKINKVGVVGEGVACYYSLRSELKPFTMVLDIGSKTINYATYTEIGTLDLSKSGTLNFGLHSLYTEIANYYLNLGRTYNVADVDDRIRNNILEIPSELKTKFINDIKNSLREKGFVDYADYSILACGGGSIVLEDVLVKKMKSSSITVLDNPLYRNVMGNKLIAKSLGL